MQISKGEFTDRLEMADNAYRTKNYIVTQFVGVKYDPEEDTATYSHDTFYRRTKQLDDLYEFAFCLRKNIDGKRISVSMYTRQYVE